MLLEQSKGHGDHAQSEEQQRDGPGEEDGHVTRIHGHGPHQVLFRQGAQHDTDEHGGGGEAELGHDVTDEAEEDGDEDVGHVIAAGVGAIIPEGNHFIAVAVYCIGMALFTMIMGNGFAAFAVITVGIGYPFLIAQGANPVVVGALGLTAGYCGTLMTPMAANFNIMPAALLETKSKYAIIISQLPVALIMLAIHIILMYVLAF